ncbi:MAG: methylmalonyl-CoA mutase [Candidatus Methanolliviera sp. GoM_asphalt]|nr:MAG: methylmalonyl-CoA mutase [Candidatus Methanolliviera sp. GoM_asphalt]
MEANKSNIVKRKERKEVFTTSSGIPIKRIYTPEDVADLDYNRDLGLSGEDPYTRGIYPTMYRGKLWTIRQFGGLNAAEATNDRYKLMYQMGVTGFAIAIDDASLLGFDPDSPEAEDEVGVGGVSVFSLKDMEDMFDGLPIDKISTAVIQAINTTCPHTAMYLALAENRGIDLRDVDGTTEGDPCSFGGCMDLKVNPAPVRQLMRLCGDLVEWCAINAPKWHPVSFTSYNYREAGVNAYQEIGGLVASAVDLIEEVLSRDRGLTVDDFVPHYTFHLASHNDFFEEIAKMRAARRMWCKIMTERYNAKDPRSKMLRFHIQTAGSSLTYQQPLNNAIRVAYQILAASLSGAQSMHACSYDEALCIPTEESALLSIRTQQIAQHEINVTNVVDPLGGSYFVESLTNEVEKKAWEYMEEIDKHGGFVEAVESGWFRAEVEKAEMKREDEVRSGEREVVGVNCFKMTEEPYKVSFFRRDPQLVEKQRAKLQKLKEERDDREVEKALEELRQVTESGENVMPAVMKALKVYTTIGEISKVWKSIFGPIVPSGLAMTM